MWFPPKITVVSFLTFLIIRAILWADSRRFENNTDIATISGENFRSKSYLISKRSKFITFIQAATKSLTNLSKESSVAYTSLNALN